MLRRPGLGSPQPLLSNLLRYLRHCAAFAQPWEVNISRLYEAVGRGGGCDQEKRLRKGRRQHPPYTYRGGTTSLKTQRLSSFEDWCSYTDNRKATGGHRALGRRTAVLKLVCQS